MNATNPLDITASGITIQDCDASQWHAQKSVVVLADTLLDLAGRDGVTINAVGGEVESISMLANGDFTIRANNALIGQGQNGTIEHTASDGWKIDGKTLSEIVREELCKLLNCD